MKLNIICFFILVIGSMLSCSEELIDDNAKGIVKGRVVDAKTFEPIVNARISSSPATSTFFSDDKGYFTFEDVVVGDYSFKAEKEGFIAKFEPVKVTADNTTQVVFELEVSTANNKPPTVPVLTAPIDKASNQPLSVNLTWTCTDPENDPLTYTVTLKNAVTDESVVYKDVKASSFEVTGLKYSTKYFWQVTVTDGINTPLNSVTNSFTTLPFPNARFLYVKKSNNNNVIYTADGEGNEVQLTSDNVNSYRPRKNLQAKKIAYITSDGSQNHIYMMNFDGSGIQKITNSIPIAGFNMEHVNYCWSTNGSQLIYPNFDKLYLINSNGSGLVKLFETPNGKFISECDWSNDGSQIALKVNDLSGYNVEIYVINTSGTVLYSVLSGLNGAVSGLHLSTNNQKLVYTRDVSGYQSANYRQFDSRVFVYNRGTNSSTEIDTQKPDGFNDLDVRFSPNEAEIIFVHTSNDGISTKFIQKASISSNGSRETLFTGPTMPDWK